MQPRESGKKMTPGDEKGEEPVAQKGRVAF